MRMALDLPPRPNIHALVKHWESICRRRLIQPGLHPKDIKLWPPHADVIRHEGSVSDFPQSRGNTALQHPGLIDPSLLPIPFIGDLSNARIVVLLDKPFFCEGDHEAEEAQGLMVRAVTQSLAPTFRNSRFQSCWLFDEALSETNPAKAWRGSEAGQFGWDEIGLAINREAGVKPEAVQLCLGTRMAILFASPYRSVQNPARSLSGLPSFRLARAAAGELLDEARTRDRILLMAATPGQFGLKLAKYQPRDGGWVHRQIWCMNHSLPPWQSLQKDSKLVPQLAKSILRELNYSMLTLLHGIR